MKRRQFLVSAGLGGAALGAPARLFAQPAPDPKTRAILTLAREQIARAGEALWRRDVAAIVDFGVHSAVPRFHIVDLEAGTVSSKLVTHGQGSDPEHDGWLNWFSNVPQSLCSSRGAYISWQWYEGKYGTSMRMGGLDDTNSNVYPRAIVMHPAEYATPEHLERWGILGRSDGCFAIGPADFPEALARLAGGRLIYADALGIRIDGTLRPRPLVHKDMSAADLAALG